MCSTMKKFAFLLLFSAAGYGAYAQAAPGALPKIKDYMEDRINGSKRITAINKDNENPVLVIVGDKIYNGSSEAFKSIPKDSIELVRTIQDSLSATPVKRILIYRRK